ncbi:cilia- and flagella-associated protein 95 isoform X1 [Ictalurus punctatus]|uniref:Cilia- and flagella-associated protein 95 isoform X1 n=1 Tax=Ictalurus punctatus TaxID=7998 RepID=A0A2D0PMB7_ICTPU|nr:cilia- and flagella-associated protein 95 isoform X1 [Ictalurus punctatus]
MNYSRKTLISDWHKNREAEPKDYDISACRDGQRKLHKSTYKHFGTHLDADWRTTTQMAQSKKEHEAKDTAKSMVQADYFHSLVFDRETGISDTAGKSILSRYQPSCTENELITTYALDYVPPRFTTKQAMPPKELMDRKLDFRRHQSQFTDVADHRRWGRNTWQDFNNAQAVVKGVAKSLYRQRNLSCP